MGRNVLFLVHFFFLLILMEGNTSRIFSYFSCISCFCLRKKNKNYEKAFIFNTREIRKNPAYVYVMLFFVLPPMK